MKQKSALATGGQRPPLNIFERALFVSGCALLFFFFASPLAFAQDLKLTPEPRQAQRREGVFNITPKTRIVINSAHAEEDRMAARTLAEEILSATGHEIKIKTARSAPRSNAIYIARVGDDKRLAPTLDALGLSIDDKFDEEGYAIDASKGRVIIAARTGRG
ncbi:MAG TPA: glycoside hydrolase family 20 zincin-like fold domain-containing protein, partial [Blastocatellia bacterium]